MSDASVAPSNETESQQATTAMQRATMESFSYNDGIVRMFVTATIVWGLVATLVGVLVALLLVLPSLFSGLENSVSALLSFGRLRPVHTNAAIFAFAGNSIFAAIYYSTQRLCKCRMWSDWLGYFISGAGKRSLLRLP